MGGSGYTVTNDAGSDTVNLTANTGVIVTGAGGNIGLLGSGDAVVASNETVSTVAGDQGES